MRSKTLQDVWLFAVGIIVSALVLAFLYANQFPQWYSLGGAVLLIGLNVRSARELLKRRRPPDA